MKKISLFAVIVCLMAWGTTAQAQNIPLYTQYNLNPFIINPAVSGVEQGHSVNLNYRSQWTKFPTAPVTSLLTYTGKFKNNGLGLMVFSDKAGSMEYTGFLAAYSYHIALNSTSKLSIGMSMQLLNYQLRPSEETLEGVNLADPVIADALNGASYLEATGGLYYTNDNGLYAGLSAPNLIQTKIGGDANVQGDLKFLTTHYFAFAGYKIKTKHLTINPSVLARKVAGAPFQIELNGQLWFLDEQLMVGGTYRTAENTVAVLFGAELDKKLRFFYSYDASFNELSNYHTGSHEITIGFNIGREKMETVID